MVVKLILDIRKSVEGNAAVYFEKAKKARKKLGGARAALERTQKKLQQLLSSDDMEHVAAAVAAAERKTVTGQQSREWYEKFRWFVSSEGFLCIGGRDATTNEIIIKKHTDRTDLVFHTEISGSPFFVVKSKSKNEGHIGSATVEEAAIATASYSRAWRAGLQSVDVYWVRPEQVSKDAKAGEYLAKGAFMIYGRKNYVPATVGLAIGVTAEGKIMGGPAAVVAKSCANHVKLIQGNSKPSDAAKKIAKILGLSSAYIDEVIRAMPAGEFKIVR